VLFPATTAADPVVTVTTIAHPFLSLALLPTPSSPSPLVAPAFSTYIVACSDRHSLPPLLPNPTIVACSGRQPLPPPLLTIPFLFCFIIHQCLTTGLTLPWQNISMDIVLDLLKTVRKHVIGLVSEESFPTCCVNE